MLFVSKEEKGYVFIAANSSNFLNPEHGFVHKIFKNGFTWTSQTCFIFSAQGKLAET